jgi:hypothetical protein
MITQSERRKDSPEHRKAQKEARLERKKAEAQQKLFPHAPIHI